MTIKRGSIVVVLTNYDIEKPKSYNFYFIITHVLSIGSLINYMSSFKKIKLKNVQQLPVHSDTGGK